MSYEIMFCGNSTDNTKIFKMQKRAIGIVTGSKKRVSCRNVIKNLKKYSCLTHNIYSYSYYLW
jgi:hypothetical protein